MKEEALLLGPHQSLVGIHTPAEFNGSPSSDKVVVVFLNSGLIHHVGPHRFHVKLARMLAARGISALRVDLSGIGDSSTRPDNIPVAKIGFHEPQEIMNSLALLGYKRFILFGICSGAKHALQAISGDQRVKGLVLVNPASSREEIVLPGQVSARYYMRRSAWNPRAWLNLFTGRVKYKTLFVALTSEVQRRLGMSGRKNISLIDIFRAELEPALTQGCRLLLVLSDRHAQYAKLLGDGVKDLQGDGQLEIAVYPEADHLFTAVKMQDPLAERVCRWAKLLQEQS